MKKLLEDCKKRPQRNLFFNEVVLLCPICETFLYQIVDLYALSLTPFGLPRKENELAQFFLFCSAVENFFLKTNV